MQSRKTPPESIREALESAGNDYSLRAKMAIVRANFGLIEELRSKDVKYRHIHARLVEATGVDMDLDTFVTYVWRERKARAAKAAKVEKPRLASTPVDAGVTTAKPQSPTKDTEQSKQGFTIDFEKSKPATFQRTERK